MTTEVSEPTEDAKKVDMAYSLVQKCDMSDETQTETMELCVSACEKHVNNHENAARMIKEGMDEKFGPSWHAVVGETFGIEVTHDCNSLLYMFYGGGTAVCVWKCV